MRFMFACFQEDWDGLEIVLKNMMDVGFNFKVVDRFGCSCLIWAMRSGIESIALRGIELKGVDLELKDRAGQTPLM